MNNHSDGNELSEKNTASSLAEPFKSIDVSEIALESANAGVWIMDPASGKFLPSKRTKELFGFLPVDEMAFEDAMLKVVDKHRKSVVAAINNTLKKQSSLFIEFPITVLTDNKQRWLSVTGGFGNSTEANSYFSGIIMDITEQKQRDLRRSRFIGIVSHELKTPLTALKGYIQMINNWAKKQKDNFTIGALSKVEKQVKKMLNMINSLLNLSGVEAGKIHLKKEEFGLDELIKEVVEETLFITSTHQIVINHCDLVTVNADRDKIEQVLINLLSNAAKYSDKTTEIEISCVLHDNNVEVSVSDKGLGIAAEDIDKLFLPHYRVESKETQKIAGFGIGLYLCAEIINRHNGKIWVESELGKGSTFKFMLPLI
jgi:signal transduction histidine kinase